MKERKQVHRGKQQVPSQGKKPYEEPKLVRHGSLVELTEGPMLGIDDGINSGTNPV